MSAFGLVLVSALGVLVGFACGVVAWEMTKAAHDSRNEDREETLP